MARWVEKIGDNYVHRLDEVVLKIGSDWFTRRELVTMVGVGNFIAATNLGEALKGFRPKTIRELAKRMDRHMLWRVDGIGDTAIFVWCHLLESAGVDVDTWLDLEIEDKPKKKKRRK